MRFDFSPQNSIHLNSSKKEESEGDIYSIKSPDSIRKPQFKASPPVMTLNLKEIPNNTMDPDNIGKHLSNFFLNEKFEESNYPSIVNSNAFRTFNRSLSNPLNFSLSLKEKFQEIDDKPKQSKKTNLNDSSKKDTQIEEHAYGIKRKKGTGCTCSKSQCLRLHCKCFRDLKYCDWQCECLGCCNSTVFEDQRRFVIENTKAINRNAFKGKIIKTNSATNVNAEGCRCKTGCNKKYCDCFRNDTGCSPICKCKNCRNQKVDLEPAQVRDIFQSGSRSKDRIIMVSNIKRPQDFSNQNPEITDQLIQDSQFNTPTPKLLVSLHHFRSKE
jgi:hypothetical protein